MSNHKRGTITRLAEAAGMSAADYVASVVNTHGTVAGAAAALDVNSRTIYYLSLIHI